MTLALRSLDWLEAKARGPQSEPRLAEGLLASRGGSRGGGGGGGGGSGGCNPPK